LEEKIRLLGRKAKTVATTFKGVGLITAVDVALAGAALESIKVGFVAALGVILLLESAALMLLGGALSFSGQPGVRKLTALLTGTQTLVTKADLDDLDAKAAAYALIGVLLFVESLALAAATV
jgi:hypothetical protein